MATKRIIAVKTRNKKTLRLILLAALLVTCVFFVKERKDMLISRTRKMLEVLLSRESDFEIHIGKISGHLLGQIWFQDVRVLSPGPFPEEDRLIFRAREISFHYRFLDFLSKKFNSKISVVVQSPEVFWRPRIHVNHRRDFPFFGWMRQWALTQKDAFEIHVMHMTLAAPAQRFKLEDMNLSYEDNRLAVEIPLRHLNVAGMDISTVINAKGDFRLGFFGKEDSIEGEIYTEGTVVNWSPLAEESSFHFSFSHSGFSLTSADVLGGIWIQGDIDFENDYRIRWDIHAENYPLSNLNFILKTAPKSMLPSRVDADLHFEGSPMSPSLEGRARIYDGFVGKKTYKAMDLHVSGVYPTVRLENSRLLLHDDSVMKFADKTLEFRELFREKTYEGLIGDAQQDTVVWGDWEFRRPRDINDKSEFLLRRTLGERAHLSFRDYKRDETVQSQDAEKVQVGLEYRLAGKNSLKLEVSEDEKFVGVERKVKF